MHQKTYREYNYVLNILYMKKCVANRKLIS